MQFLHLINSTGVAVATKMQNMTTNNLAFLRRRLNLSLTALSEMIQEPVSTLSRLESGERRLSDKYRAKLATALQCAPEDLDSAELHAPTVPVIGLIRDKATITDPPANKPELVEKFDSFPADTVAVRVKGNVLFPYHGNGDLLYFQDRHQPNEKLFLNKECYVETAGGRRVLAWVTKGSEKDTYVLHAPASPVQLDVKLTKICPIIHIKRV